MSTTNTYVSNLRYLNGQTEEIAGAVTWTQTDDTTASPPLASSQITFTLSNRFVRTFTECFPVHFGLYVSNLTNASASGVQPYSGQIIFSVYGNADADISFSSITVENLYTDTPSGFTTQSDINGASIQLFFYANQEEVDQNNFGLRSPIASGPLVKST